MQEGGFALISLFHHFPIRSKRDETGEEMRDVNGNLLFDWSDGPFGMAIISLTHPQIYVVVDVTRNEMLHSYIDDSIVPMLKYFGDGPYSLADLGSEEVLSELSEQYAEYCGQESAYVTMEVKSVDWSKSYDPLFVSEELSRIIPSRVSVWTFLQKLEVSGLV
jgi:hypothetical protein